MTTTETAPAWTLTHVAPATIKAHPDNPRTEVTDIDDLAASIAEVGILEPLVVAPAHDGMNARSMGKATHLLIAGHRRLAAAKKAKLATVPVIVRADLTTRAAQVEAMLVENLQRVDLTPVEEADAYQLVMNLDGLTQKALAAKVGQPVSRIRDRLKLTRISQPVRDQIQAHQITIADALAIAEFDDDPKAQKELLKQIGTRDLQFALNRARGDREAAQKRQALLDRLTATGLTVHKEQPKGAKPLSELNLTNGWASSTDEDLEAVKHADCPGRTAWFHYSSVYFGCTEPKLHPKPKVVKSEDELQREAEQKATLDVLAANLDAATRVRGDFLRVLVYGARPTSGHATAMAATRDRLRALVLNRLDLPGRYYYGDQLKRAATYLGMLAAVDLVRDKNSRDRDYATALATAIGHALADVDVPGLVVALDLATHLGDELALRKATTYPSYDSASGWIRALTAYGYEWSTFEREQFTWTEGTEQDERAWTVDGPGEIVTTTDETGWVYHDDDEEDGAA